MKKIKLEIEALHVDSFVAGSTQGMPRGTVQGNVFNQDIPHNESEGLACATNGFNYCAAPSYGCVSYTGADYNVSALCP